MNDVATITGTIVATYEDGRTETLEISLAQSADGKRPGVTIHTDNQWREPDGWFPEASRLRQLDYTDVTIVTGRVDPYHGTWARHTIKEAPPRGWRRVAAALTRMRRRVSEIVRREASE